MLLFFSVLWLKLSCKGNYDDLFVPDHNLVQFGYEELPVLDYSETFVGAFEKNGKELHFIAAWHSSDPSGPLFLTVENEFDTFSPDSTVVERRDSDMGISPQYYINRFSDYNNVDGEPDYTIYLSVTNVPFTDFIAAEPSTGIVEERIKGFSIDSRTLDEYDYCYFAFMRRMQGLKSEGTISDQTQFESEFGPRISALIADYDMTISMVPVVTDFYAWYLMMAGKTFVFDDEDFSFFGRNDDIELLWYYIDYIRDTNVIENIAMMCNYYEKVLVVYGSAHYQRLKAVLIDMFGMDPQEYQLYN